jgi:hypothetical protein
MKTSFKTSIIAIALLTVFLSLSGVAGACMSIAGSEYMVVFHPGITWQEAKNEVASWGNSYELAAITSRKEQRDVMKLLGGLPGEFWIGGYQGDSQKWQWSSGEAWGYSNWAKSEPDRFSRRGKESERDWKHGRRNNQEMNERASSDVGHYLAIQGGHKDRWMWYDEQDGRGISGFIAERRPGNAVPTPIPPAAMLLGSGMAMIGGLRLRGRKKAS